MRNQLSAALFALAQKDKDFIMMTGDLGFNAFESLREFMGEKFINAGVAEQNMVSVAAGLAYTGFSPWTYSIAPFIVLKTIEQIRNDIAIPNMNVKIIGNGGGFGYGIMGTTHHILEDIALFSNLPNFTSFIPAFNNDVVALVGKMSTSQSPGYLRLGYDATNFQAPPYTAVRKLDTNPKPKKLVISLGPVVQQALPLIENKTGVWVVTELPCKLPKELFAELSAAEKVVVSEECGGRGGLGDYIATMCAQQNVHLKSFTHAFASYSTDHTYGSQAYHLVQSSLDTNSLRKILI